MIKSSILTKKDMKNIKKLRDKGLKNREIAEKYGVSQSVISNVINNRYDES